MRRRRPSAGQGRFAQPWVFAFLCAGLAAASPALANCVAGRVGDMPLTIAHARLFVVLTINDTPGQFLVDTGAAQSVLDESFAGRTGVQWDHHQPVYTLNGFGGSTLPVHAGRIRMLGIAGMHVADREMPIHDFGSEASPGGGTIAGLLGADLLDLFDVELDPVAGKLALWRLAGCRDIEPLHWTGDYVAIPMRRTAGKQLRIPIWIDGADFDATLDTGAQGLYLSHAAALKAGATEDELAHDPQTGGGGIGGRMTSRTHLFHTLLVGKDEYHDVKARVGEAGAGTAPLDGSGALIGLPALLHHRVWLSYGTETLFLQKLKE